MDEQKKWERSLKTSKKEQGFTTPKNPQVSTTKGVLKAVKRKKKVHEVVKPYIDPTTGKSLSPRPVFRNWKSAVLRKQKQAMREFSKANPTKIVSRQTQLKGRKVHGV